MKLRTNIYLEARQAAALDDAAHTRGVSRAELVRQLIDRGIGHAGPADLEADLAAIEASFGVLAGEDMTHELLRGPDERTRHLSRLARR